MRTACIKSSGYPSSLYGTRYMLDLPRDVIHSVARFRLRVHTLCFETGTWNSSSSPTCNLCEAGCPGWKTCSLSLHAPSAGFSPQQVCFLILTDRILGCVCFFRPGKQTPIFHSFRYAQCRFSKLRLRAHTLKVEAAAWLEGFSCTCDQCPGEDEHVLNEVVHA